MKSIKVVAFNGSPRKNGNTSCLINVVLDELKKEGIKTEEVHVGKTQIHGCMGCMQCFEKKDGECVLKNDSVNGWIKKVQEADGIILGSPVYCADLSAQIKAFIDRVGLVCVANGSLLKRKVGASVLAVRRAGALPAFHSLNSFYTIQEMIIVGSSYWNMGFGLKEGDVEKDEEGIRTMRNLGIKWLGF